MSGSRLVIRVSLYVVFYLVAINGSYFFKPVYGFEKEPEASKRAGQQYDICEHFVVVWR